MFKELKGQIVLVTGGSRGIGSGLVESLAKAGAHVIFTYRSSASEANVIVNKINEQGGRCAAFKADITDQEASQNLVTMIEDEIGPIYGLVNNAGITQDKSFLMMSAESWQQVLSTNLDGTVFLTQAVLLQMMRRKTGKIIMMSSVSGLQASPGQASYSASKAALIGLTRTLSHEVARYNIQVNAIAPGFIETEMVEQMSEKSRQQIPKLVPARRMGSIKEVAEPVLFLLSNGSNYITGHTLVVDGGLSV
ncbi:MAG: 3-oxoacyl-[acyl-carrier protein] reductase [Cognaticolwellia sp.]|jgi:3-oxoacyl-[acyl-carrier protein] reductase